MQPQNPLRLLAREWDKVLAYMYKPHPKLPN